jgi:hypothetical protein
VTRYHVRIELIEVVIDEVTGIPSENVIDAHDGATRVSLTSTQELFYKAMEGARFAVNPYPRINLLLAVLGALLYFGLIQPASLYDYIPEPILSHVIFEN